MANYKLTHNMRFFKVLEEYQEEDREVRQALQQITNEYYLLTSGQQSQQITQRNVRRIIAQLNQAIFRVNELNAAAPLHLRD